MEQNWLVCKAVYVTRNDLNLLYHLKDCFVACSPFIQSSKNETMLSLALPTHLLYTTHTQSGKVHFGYIYGVGLMGCIGMYVVLSLMSSVAVSVGCVVSVLGYCLLPMVLLSCFSLIVSLQ